MTILGQTLEVGDRIWFERERQGFTVQAFSDRFIICTKPFNARKTYLYSIVDLKRDVRGPDDLVFGSFYPYDTKEGAEENLRALERGAKLRDNVYQVPSDQDKDWSMEVSYRTNVPLKITKVKKPSKAALT